jgi:hypothetical protein
MAGARAQAVLLLLLQGSGKDLSTLQEAAWSMGLLIQSCWFCMCSTVA